MTFHLLFNPHKCVTISIKVAFILFFFSPFSLQAQSKKERAELIRRSNEIRRQDSIHQANQRNNNIARAKAAQEKDSIELVHAKARIAEKIKKDEDEAAERKRKQYVARRNDSLIYIEEKRKQTIENAKTKRLEDSLFNIKKRLSQCGTVPFNIIYKCLKLDSLASFYTDDNQSIKAERTYLESENLLKSKFIIGNIYKICGVKNKGFFNFSNFNENRDYVLWVANEINTIFYIKRKESKFGVESITSDNTIEKIESLKDDSNFEITFMIIKKTKNYKYPVQYSLDRADEWHELTLEIECKILSVKILN
ncbi:hypothetical protein [Aurantibacillus circumpalustris]|uniref:hypothetical protein n=1 Tax=Aurantibacillus circumpalustris TaxID=3036359 RepID=UPI00295B6061|nr:hypothetical protein [Aurantibacillus circumpalustris]